MDQSDTEHGSSAGGRGSSTAQEYPQRHTPGPLSQSDPDPDRAPSRTPIWVVVLIVLVVVGFVVLHLTGVVGPGTN
jgi:hypothetical protein